MSFDSVNFLLFFPVVALAYYLIPEGIGGKSKNGENKNRINFKSIWLLLASYYFYMSWNPKYAVLIILSTVITFVCGLMLDRINDSSDDDGKKKSKKNMALAVSFIINLSILAFFKYGQFTIDNVTALLNSINITVTARTLDILLPVGISFYTFQALGYTMDVYRGDIKAEKSFVQYALFVSFFPQLVAGPIERSKNLLEQLKVSHKFDLDNIRDGLLMMLWGYFMKLVIADRTSLFVDTVYNNYDSYVGWYIVIATVLFGFQIYCDFNGYTMIARGAAKIMGFELMENFDAPYLSTTVAEFWKKWHISLTSWFRDYLYIPLGGNRKGAARKYINILIVFAVSGLWHGAEWSFVVWGALNGLYQVIGGVLRPIRNKLVDLFHLNRESLGHRIISIIATFAMVDFAWMFFRASTIKDALKMMVNIFKENNIWILFDHESLYTCGLDKYDFFILILALLILMVADIVKTKKISIRNDFIYKQDTWFRWTFYIVAFIFVLILGMWGTGYENAAFLYFQF